MRDERAIGERADCLRALSCAMCAHVRVAGGVLPCGRPHSLQPRDKRNDICMRNSTTAAHASQRGCVRLVHTFGFGTVISDRLHSPLSAPRATSSPRSRATTTCEYLTPLGIGRCTILSVHVHDMMTAAHTSQRGCTRLVHTSGFGMGIFGSPALATGCPSRNTISTLACNILPRVPHPPRHWAVHHPPPRAR